MKESDTNDRESRGSLFREPWLLLILAPLFATVILSSTMVFVAFYGADDVVSDNYYKDGRLLTQEFTSEEYARSQGLSATLRFDWVSAEALLRLNTDVEVSTLNLLISHPAKAALDQYVEMKKIAPQTFRADLDKELAGRWYFRLVAFNDVEPASTSNEIWRLNGEADLTQSARVELQ